MPDPTTDPVFNIQSPANNDIELPNFSVCGVCSDITNPTSPGITVTCGPNNNAVPAQLNVLAKTWEAVLNNVGSGPQVVTATCSTGGTTQVTISVGSAPLYDPLYTVNPPTSLLDGGGSWAGWTVGGTYIIEQVTQIEVYLTRRGKKQPPSGPTTAMATLKGDGTWTLALDSLHIDSVGGHGFCLHTVATTLSGKQIHGSVPRIFTGPPEHVDPS